MLLISPLLATCCQLEFLKSEVLKRYYKDVMQTFSVLGGGDSLEVLPARLLSKMESSKAIRPEL